MSTAQIKLPEGATIVDGILCIAKDLAVAGVVPTNMKLVFEAKPFEIDRLAERIALLKDELFAWAGKSNKVYHLFVYGLEVELRVKK